METAARDHVIELPRTVATDPDPLVRLARECYPDLAPTVEEDGTSWRIRLSSRAREAALFDPDLPKVLSDMGAGFEAVMGWHRWDRIGAVTWLESLNHSWALAAWSRWLEAGGGGRPLLVHVDAHDDLAVPPLLCGTGDTTFTGVMEDITVDLKDSASVCSAVRRGFVGIGSFITPFLRVVPSDVVHLAPSPSGADAPVRRRFEVGGAPWDPDPRFSRLTIRENREGSTYQRIEDPSELASMHTPGTPVLVDVDLDYFELFEARSIGATDSASPHAILQGLEPLARDIVVVTVACSPGFCPAGRWAGLLEELRKGLRDMLGSAA